MSVSYDPLCYISWDSSCCHACAIHATLLRVPNTPESAFSSQRGKGRNNLCVCVSGQLSLTVTTTVTVWLGWTTFHSRMMHIQAYVMCSQGTNTFWGISTVLYLNYELKYHMCCVFLFLLFVDQLMNSSGPQKSNRLLLFHSLPHWPPHLTALWVFYNNFNCYVCHHFSPVSSQHQTNVLLSLHSDWYAGNVPLRFYWRTQ